MIKKYDVLIIGTGPAGLTSAIYCSRAGLKVGMIEKSAPGGKVTTTSIIENWLGDESIDGPSLAMRMYQHAIKEGAKFLFGEVNSIDFKNKIINFSNQQAKYNSLIIASGTSEIIPEHIKGIYKYNQKGVSYCAICDGPFFKGEDVAVLGGGNSAIEESIYLSSIVKKLYLIVRNKIKAEKKSLDILTKKNNVEIILKDNIKEIKGNEKIQSIILDSGKEIEIKGLFPYIGANANTTFLKNSDIEMEKGFIKTNKSMQTNKKDVYAIGDVIIKHVRQISTASADGAIVARQIIDDIS